MNLLSAEPSLKAEPAAQPTARRYVVLFWLCLAAAIGYACRNGLGVAESTIRADMELDKESMGLIMSLFFIPYALGQIPGGWMADRVGSRQAISLCAVGWSIATLAMGVSEGLVLLAAAWFANGLFQAGLFPACTNTFSKWFSANRRAIASGWLASSMSIGSAAASVIAALLVEKFGWRWAFGVFGVSGIVWTAAFRRTFHDLPEQDSRVNAAELSLIRRPISEKSKNNGTSKSESVAVPEHDGAVWLALLLSPATWLICMQQFCRAGGQIFFSTWFPTYLQEARGVSVAQSGLLNSLPLAAIVGGCVLGGMVSDWVLTVTGSRRWGRQGVASICMLICSAFVFASSSVRNPLVAVLLISAGTMIAAIGGPTAYAITIDMGNRHVAKLFGCMNMVGNLGAGLVTIGIPYFLKMTGQWDQVLYMFGGLWFAAGVFWLLLNPNGDVFQYSLVKRPLPKPGTTVP